MDTKNFISIKQICECYNVPESFIDSLYDYELIEVVTIKEIQHINTAQINVIEKLITFHYDLNINIEGIHAISNLLNTIDSLQSEIKELKNKLNFYESRLI
ncbi:Chaperone modulatory protein CbpM [Mariniflexile rhizosphaerae]|uniref:chaperone modulator CbpM n=1 Tax=unclassified Mariniflexile TaxID=2643887 RepID=UPI000E3373EB|nr:chaperone modulator CbpM [Mariniflexile sp. TRM1-10]AXP82252.1 Chaperone modulatory protein CbpM [Mariniflexile sp. TRM1-10]